MKNKSRHVLLTIASEYVNNALSRCKPMNSISHHAQVLYNIANVALNRARLCSLLLNLTGSNLNLGFSYDVCFLNLGASLKT